MTPFTVAQRFIGEIREIPGEGDSPFIQWCLSLCGFGPDSPDETPWCSAFLNACCWLIRAPRTKSARARSWLGVGAAVALEDAVPGWDVVVLQRGAGTQPGPEVQNAPGHVGFFAGVEDGRVLVLGGNQGNTVSVASFPRAKVLGVRRLR